TEGLADQQDRLTLSLERERCRLCEVVEHADAADARCRQDAAALRLVVERYVPGNDREVERLAGFGDAAHATDELSHDLRLLRIAEVQIVGDGERLAANRGDVAPGFGDGLLAAFERVSLAIARGDIDGERQ